MRRNLRLCLGWAVASWSASAGAAGVGTMARRNTLRGTAKLRPMPLVAIRWNCAPRWSAGCGALASLRAAGLKSLRFATQARRNAGATATSRVGSATATGSSTWATAGVKSSTVGRHETLAGTVRGWLRLFAPGSTPGLLATWARCPRLKRARCARGSVQCKLKSQFNLPATTTATFA